MSESDPNGLNPNQPGAKLDSGKSPVWRGFVNYFPRAIRLISGVSGFGAAKYSWGGWASVPDGVDRYTDALLRHLTGEKIDGPIDPETGLLHAAQVAWNAMARLELMLTTPPVPASSAAAPPAPHSPAHAPLLHIRSRSPLSATLPSNLKPGQIVSTSGSGDPVPFSPRDELTSPSTVSRRVQ